MLRDAYVSSNMPKYYNIDWRGGGIINHSGRCLITILKTNAWHFHGHCTDTAVKMTNPTFQGLHSRDDCYRSMLQVYFSTNNNYYALSWEGFNKEVVILTSRIVLVYLDDDLHHLMFYFSAEFETLSAIEIDHSATRIGRESAGLFDIPFFFF